MKKRITFYANEETVRWLEQRQAETGACVSEIIRRELRKVNESPAIEYRDNEVAAGLRRAGVLLSARSQEAR